MILDGFDDLFGRAEGGPEAVVVVVGVDTLDSELARRGVLADLGPGGMTCIRSTTLFLG